MNWPLGPQNQDTALACAAHLLCDLGPVAVDPFCVPGWMDQELSKVLSCPEFDVLDVCYAEGIQNV